MKAAAICTSIGVIGILGIWANIRWYHTRYDKVKESVCITYSSVDYVCSKKTVYEDFYGNMQAAAAKYLLENTKDDSDTFITSTPCDVGKIYSVETASGEMKLPALSATYTFTYQNFDLLSVEDFRENIRTQIQDDIEKCTYKDCLFVWAFEAVIVIAAIVFMITKWN